MTNSNRGGDLTFVIWYLRIEKSLVGDSSGGGTPGPIPNPEVKPASADGT